MLWNSQNPSNKPSIPLSLSYRGDKLSYRPIKEKQNFLQTYIHMKDLINILFKFFIVFKKSPVSTQPISSTLKSEELIIRTGCEKRTQQLEKCISLILAIITKNKMIDIYNIPFNLGRHSALLAFFPCQPVYRVWLTYQKTY